MLKSLKRRTLFGTAILFLIITFVTAGCGSSNDNVFTDNQGNSGVSPGGPPGLAPTVTFVAPESDATDVPRNTTILATFSQSMDSASLSPTTFLVTGPNSASVAGVVTTTGATATFRPSQPLTANTVYTATITTGVRGQNGVALASPFTWTFTTGNTFDNTAPTVTFTDPASGETGVATNQSILANFSETMDPATLNTRFTLTRANNVAVQGTVTYTGLQATFNPQSDLQPNTSYTATIKAGATDLAGNPLANDFVWTFTTGIGPNTTAPIVVSTLPANNATNVNVSSNISATFSKSMLPSTLDNISFSVAGVTGTVAYDVNSKTATFNPTVDLDTNTLYNVTITTAATDLAGNPLANNETWSFRTSVIDLGAASFFGSFGGNAGITNQGLLTRINGGAIGTTAAATLITGFIDGTNGDEYTVTPLNAGIVELGIFTAGDPEATAGANDAQTAFDTLRDLPGGITLATTQLGGRVLAPGVYKSATSYEITGNSSLFDLTLDGQGDPNAVWVFQIGSSLTVGGPALPRTVNLINGAQAKNVYWQVGAAATINAAGGGTMVGTIIASAGVTFSTAGNVALVTLDGRALGLNASVTMVNTIINVPAP